MEMAAHRHVNCGKILAHFKVLYSHSPKLNTKFETQFSSEMLWVMAKMRIERYINYTAILNCLHQIKTKGPHQNQNQAKKFLQAKYADIFTPFHQNKS